VKRNEFRADLYYRLNIIPIHIPPLRERKSDIPLLVSHFMETLSAQNRLEPKEFTAQTMTRFIQYDWPGNVRELMNVVEQLVSLVEGKYIKPEHLPREFADPDDHAGRPAKANAQYFWPPQDDEEKELILRVLREEKGNKTKAAQRLGIHRSTLYEKLKKIGIT